MGRFRSLLVLPFSSFRDNENYLSDRRYRQRMADRTRNYKDDDSDDFPPSGSIGGQGPSLVF